MAKKVSEQAGIIAGQNPTHWDPKNPVVVFIIQVRTSSSPHSPPTAIP